MPIVVADWEGRPKKTQPGADVLGFLAVVVSWQNCPLAAYAVVARANGRSFSCCNYAPLIHRQPETDHDRWVNTLRNRDARVANSRYDEPHWSLTAQKPDDALDVGGHLSGAPVRVQDFRELQRGGRVAARLPPQPRSMVLHAVFRPFAHPLDASRLLVSTPAPHAIGAGGSSVEEHEMWMKPGTEHHNLPCRLDFVISGCMAKAIRDPTKSNPKMGRPKTTGPGEPQVVRMHDQQLEAIDDWIEAQGEKISRPEAIRRLVELGLRAKTK